MIKSIQLKNFQSHKNSILEFDKGVNIIIGKTDSGKSAIIRAIKLITFNKPSGDDYRSDWGGVTKVHLTTDENKISRIKSNKDNLYVLDKLEFKAFGQNVPNEIKNALNMDELNFQLQLDSPFLLSQSSGQISVFFNKIAKLDKIDISLFNIQKEIRDTTNLLKYTDEEINEKESKIKEFDYLLEFEEKIIEIELLGKRFVQITDSCNKLIDWENDYVELTEKIEIIINSISQENEINNILLLIEEKNKKELKYTSLKQLALEIFYIAQKINHKKKEISSEVLVNSILDLQSNYKKHLTTINKIQKLYKDIADIKISRENKEKVLKKLEQEFHDNFPEICPLCGTNLKKTIKN
jgi:DNA repair exonuclease SbcCD ATPase subunit